MLNNLYLSKVFRGQLYILYSENLRLSIKFYVHCPWLVQRNAFYLYYVRTRCSFRECIPWQVITLSSGNRKWDKSACRRGNKSIWFQRASHSEIDFHADQWCSSHIDISKYIFNTIKMFTTLINNLLGYKNIELNYWSHKNIVTSQFSSSTILNACFTLKSPLSLVNFTDLIVIIKILRMIS